MGRPARRPAPRPVACHRRCHRGPGRGNSAGRGDGYRPADPLHGQGGAARGRELSLFRRSGPHGPRWQKPARAGAGEYDDPGSHRPGGDHHAVEYALYALHLENRPGTGCGLHIGSQTGRVFAAVGAVAGRNRRKCGIAAGGVEPGQRDGRRGGAGLDRTSRHPRHWLCRGKPHRVAYHAAGGGYAETGAFRTGRQEPGGGVRRCRSGPRRRCRRLHDLVAEWRALHLIVTPAGRSADL